MKSIYLCPLFITLSLLVLLPQWAKGQTPNVLVIMTDDQGYGDLSCHGNPYIKTPNLNALASGSLRLTDFHVAPMCTATRGQLMTGLDAFRNGAMNVSSGRSLLRPELKTMADVFKSAGYRTAMFGKWHLGDNYPYRPQDRGFDHSVWFPSSHIGSSADVWNNDYFDDTYRVNGKLREFKGYCTDVFFAEAIRWMTAADEEDATGNSDADVVNAAETSAPKSLEAKSGQKKQTAETSKPDTQPFFAYIALNSPHWPWFVPDADRIRVRERALANLEKLDGLKDRPKRLKALIRFLAMCENVDRNFGELDAALKAAGMFEDTIVVFLSDNGSTFGHDYFPAGMKGKKTQLWEGGHRVPCFIRFPSRQFKPRDIDNITQVQDLLPTLSALAGPTVVKALPNDLDGESLVPCFKGEDHELDDRKLVINYSRMAGYQSTFNEGNPIVARRDGGVVLWKRWRLIANRELYDLEKDPLQNNDVAGQHPDVVKAMRDHLQTWWDGVMASANETQRIVVGHQKEMTSTLSACDWLENSVTQQREIRLGKSKAGSWALKIHQAGTYRFELRRWPKESGLTMSEAAEAKEVNQGILPKGKALDIKSARIKIAAGGKVLFQGSSKSDGDNDSFVFLCELPDGPVELTTWLDNANGDAICGAYYVYVSRGK